jgi:CHAT domain-containing protein/tetratricopeptide (TPR) repeat protein
MNSQAFTPGGAVIMRLLVWLLPLLVAPAVHSECPLDTSARQLIKAGQYAEAEPAARSQLEAAEMQNGPDSVEAACALDAIVEARWRGGKAREEGTVELARRAVAIFEARLGISKEMGRSLSNLALVHEMRGDNPEAKSAHERSLAVTVEALGADSVQAGRGHNNLGWFLYLTADYDGARSHLERALAIFETSPGPDSIETASALNNLGVVYWRAGRYEEARPLYERSLAIKEAKLPPDHPNLARSVENLAIQLRTIGDYAAARSLHERAIGMRERSLGPDHPDLANNLHNYAGLLQESGDFDGARRLYERALRIFEVANGPEHRNVALALSNLAGVLGDLGACEEALRNAERSVQIFEKSMGPGHPDVADGFNAVAAAYRCSSDPAGAIAAYERMRAILKDHLDPDHPKFGLILRRLSEQYLLLGDLDRARTCAEEALASLQDHLGPEHPDTAAALTLLSTAEWAAGARAEALQHARQAADSVLDHVRDTLGSMPERQALLLTQSRARPEVVLFSGLLAGGDDQPAWRDAAWSWTLRRRGIVLEELAARHRAVEAGASAEARAAWDRLSRARQALAALWVRGSLQPTDVQKDVLARARDSKERAEADLARLSAQFRRTLEYRAIEVAEVRRHLPEGSAVVEIVNVEVMPPNSTRKEARDVALFLRSDGASGAIDLGPSSSIDAGVTAWRQALDETSAWLGSAEESSRIEGRLRDPGTRLREMAWDPIVRVLGEVRTVFFVPEGALHAVDLKALPAPGGGYLVERQPAVHLLGSARDLVRLADDGTARKGVGLLVLGAPDFDAGTERMARLAPVSTGPVFRSTPSTCSAMQEARWTSLPRSAREAKRIQGMVARNEPVQLLTGAAANEDRFKREAPGKRVLHLATHGFFLPERCSAAPDSTASDSNEDRVTAAAARSGGAATESPLLLSGLVLAGANRRHDMPNDAEDGILTAEELAALDLSGVELAVLSACETGRGAVELGEGVFGLRRAVEMAEARAVVMSLWRVPDQQTLQWMTTFYRERARGRSLIAATQAASLASLERLRDQDRPTHPYLWAGFVAAGDWR